MSLTSITIPASVTSIDGFYGCTGLKSIYVAWDEPLSLNGDIFEYLDKDSCTLYVPTGTAQLYRAADGWKEFKNIVEYDTTTGINSTIGQEADAGRKVVRRYGIDGRETDALRRGINIVRYDDGTVRKVVVK